MKMNKKGALPSAIFGTNFVMAMFLAIVLLIFLTGGGASTILNITKFVKDIPTIIWVFLGVIILFKLIWRKK